MISSAVTVQSNVIGAGSAATVPLDGFAELTTLHASLTILVLRSTMQGTCHRGKGWLQFVRAGGVVGIVVARNHRIDP